MERAVASQVDSYCATTAIVLQISGRALYHCCPLCAAMLFGHDLVVKVLVGLHPHAAVAPLLNFTAHSHVRLLLQEADVQGGGDPHDAAQAPRQGGGAAAAAAGLALFV